MPAAAVPPPARTVATACADALPDALAALACVVAWIRPDALGFDLLAWAAPLFFVELPIALIATLAGVRRVRDGELARDERLRFLLLPTVVLALLAGGLLGVTGIVAVLWLGAMSIGRLLLQGPDVRPAVRGLWLVFGRRSASTWFELVEQRPAPQPGVVVVPAGHEQVMAGATIGSWIWIPIAIAIFPSLGVGGASEAYAVAVGWHDSPIGRVVPAHVALAAGAMLFAVRTLVHFEGLGEPPPAVVEHDALLQEVIDTVEGKGAWRKNPKRSRRSHDSDAAV